MKLNTLLTGMALSGVALFAQQKPNPVVPGAAPTPAPVRAPFPTNAPPRMAQEQLTPEQRKAIETATASLKDEQHKIMVEQSPIRTALYELESADPIDEAAIRAKVAELSKLDAEASIVRAKIKKAIRGVLPKEQYDRMYNRSAIRRPAGPLTNGIAHPAVPTVAPKPLPK